MPAPRVLDPPRRMPPDGRLPKLLALGAVLGAGAPPAVAAQPAQAAPAAALVGTVRDSLAGGPLAGAAVHLVPAASPTAAVRIAETDSAGAYRFEAVAPGRYWVAFAHPRLDSLGLEPPQWAVTVAAGGAPARADLGVPGAATLAAAVCGDVPGAALFGRVLDAADARPAARGAVVVRWGEVAVGAGGVRREVREVRALVGAGGRYAACGLPADEDVRVQARGAARADAPAGAAAYDAVADDPAADALASGAVDLRLDAGAPALYRDLWVAPPSAPRPAGALGTSAARGAAGGAGVLAGRVRRADGRPLAGARVVVRDAPAGDTLAVTDAGGAYRLAGLPAGTRSVDVLALGYAPVRAAADLRPGRVATLDLALTARVATLPGVRVYAAPARAGSTFARNQRWAGVGYFRTADDVERRRPQFVAGALDGIPGLRATDTRFGRPVYTGRLGCTPRVYLDGVWLRGYAGGSPVPGGVPAGGPIAGRGVRTAGGTGSQDFGTADLDFFLSVREIGGIEVYPDGQFAPPPYVLAGGCAVIGLWTKGALL